MFLEEFLGHLLDKKRWGDGVMRDLEVSLRAKGPVHPACDAIFERCGTFAYFARLLGCAFSALSGGFLLTSYLATHRAPLPPSASIMQILFAVPPRPVILLLGCSCACMPVTTKMQYYDLQLGFAKILLKHGEEPMKMELARIILNKHSDDRSLVEALKRHFVADHLLSDQHQEKPLLRWRERGSYMDSALLEKRMEYEAMLQKMMKELQTALRMLMKKYEAKSSDDGAKSSVNTGLFQEDPLACMLGTPGYATEFSKPPE
uniref:Uncharacterized protein n=1 Tax=Avena sativa TaxID=4498 RepID=A0ACD5V8U5_AVESA